MPHVGCTRLRHLLLIQNVTETRCFSNISANIIRPEATVQRNPTRDRQTVLQKAGLRMRMATVQDGPAILDFMREYFYKEEPLNAAMKVTTSGYGTECRTLDEICIGELHHNVSSVCEAIDGSLKGFAAVSVCGISDKAKDELIKQKIASVPPLDPLPPTAGPEERNLRGDRFMEMITAEADVFGSYPQLDKLLDSKGAAVHPKFRNLGVATVLIENDRESARANGLHLVRSYTASPYTLAVNLNLGCKIFHRIPFSKFRDSEGNQIFKAKPPYLDELLYLIWEIDL